MKYRTKIRIYSSYLALGSIALYLSLTRLVNYIWASNQISSVFKDELLSRTLPSFTFAFVAGILMIITYHGLLNLKKYPKYTGIIGCFFFVLHDVNYLFQSFDFRSFEMEYLIVLMPKLLTMIASIILLILTLIYRKKLDG